MNRKRRTSSPSIAIAFWIGEESLDATRRVVAHQFSIDRLQETLSTVDDAETGQRGFLLTGQDDYLEPYRKAVQRVNTGGSALT